MTTTRAHADPHRVIDELDLHVRELVRREGVDPQVAWPSGTLHLLCIVEKVGMSCRKVVISKGSPSATIVTVPCSTPRSRFEPEARELPSRTSMTASC